MTDADGPDIIENEIQGARWRTDGFNFYYRQRRWRGSLRPLAGGRLMGDPLICLDLNLQTHVVG